MVAITAAPATVAEENGFTLLEVLVSLVIVSLVVVVYFQLMSAGMKLELQSRERVDKLLAARQTFASLSLQDVRDDDFQWKGSAEPYVWRLEIQAVEMQNATLEEQTPLKLNSELYKYTFQFFEREQKLLSLTKYVRYDPGFFSQEFKNEHLQ